ncbi:hypothetical protein AYI68_g7967 [Smittium mucronatum]|uniref:Uncharacterized protein n=1 Tax=Smittium mucronatum TaxID=133383 RepID=A0A1R0GM69_9FUNG|nr:hypothetical protein AYI68_g7967 [Smittium mucronatum]
METKRNLIDEAKVISVIGIICGFSNKKNTTAQSVFYATFFPINLNFALVFLSMSPYTISLIRKYVFGNISKWALKKDGTFFLGAGHSISLDNTIGVHVFLSIWFIVWMLIHGIIGLIVFDYNSGDNSQAHGKRDRHDSGNDGSIQLSANGKIPETTDYRTTGIIAAIIFLFMSLLSINLFFFLCFICIYLFSLIFY